MTNKPTFSNITDLDLVQVLCGLGLNANSVKLIHDEVYDGYVVDEQLNVQNLFQDLLDKNNIDYEMVVEVKNRSGLSPWDQYADDDEDYFVYNLHPK
jgi:hypothetical protein